MACPEHRDEQDDDFNDMTRLSDQALEHARRFGTSLQPHAYEVWYAYVAGDEPGLRDRVDRELGKGEVVDLETLERIYQDHFLEKRLSHGMTQIGVQLDTGLRGTVAALRDGLATTQRFLDSLRGAQDRITGLSKKDDAARSVRELLDLATLQASQTEALNEEMLKVRAHVLELQDELQRLRERAYLDHLTQIANRLHMEEVLAREMVVARAAGTPLSLALGDLDHFKRVNDTFGHAIGDAVLRHVAGLIKRNVKGQDTPARFGGEEFGVVLPKTALPGAVQVVDKIRRQLAETDFILNRDGGPSGHISISFGVTTLRPDDTIAELIQRVDRMLYQAKQHGRNRVESEP